MVQKFDDVKEEVCDLVSKIKDDDNTVIVKVKSFVKKVEEVFTKNHDENLTRLTEHYEAKHQDMIKAFGEHEKLMEQRYNNQVEAFKSQQTKAQERDDKLAAQVTNLTELVTSLKPHIEKLATSQPESSSDAQRKIDDEKIKELFADQFTEQKSNQESKVVELLEPLRKLRIISDKWKENERKKGQDVESHQTAQQGGERRKKVKFDEFYSNKFFVNTSSAGSSGFSGFSS